MCNILMNKMNFIKDSIIILANTFKKTFQVKGRSSRKEYIIFSVFFILFNFVNYLAAHVILFFKTYTTIIGLPLFIYYLLILITYSTLTIRRLHDLNLKSYWLL